MKNNVISIIVDSAIADYFGNSLCKKSPSPFVDSLLSESIVASKMYSPGPFTDAATRSLFTGRDGLDDYCFYFKYNTSPVNHYKVFKENGYETIGIYYPYYINGKNVTDYIDHIYYASGFVFTSEWFGIFSYYEEKAKNHQLSAVDLKLLSARLKLMFDVWLKFYHDVLHEKECRYMIEECIGQFDVQQAYDLLVDEYRKFQEGNEEFIYDFISKGKSHALANLDQMDVEGYINRDFLKEKVYARHKKDFNYFKRENFKANWWKNRPKVKQLWSGLKQYANSKDKDVFYCIANYFLCLNSFGRMQKRSMNPMWQEEQSSYRHFLTAIHAIENRTCMDKPFYLSVHVEDPHNYLSCFTYDTQDPSIVDEEMRVLRDYVKELDGEFVGDLSYILSIRYVDYYIEKFCDYLKAQNLWENTTLLICADHGSSYSFYPLHGKHVNCFDEECYHIPMIIRHPGLNGYKVEKYCSSKDILPTLLDMVGISQDKDFKGQSILNKDYDRGYAIIEYTGGGCPDVISKQLWLGLKDDNYFVGYKIKLEDSICNVRPDTVYDLSVDPKGLVNIADTVDLSKVLYLSFVLEDRLTQIRKDTNAFLDNLIKGEISF